MFLSDNIGYVTSSNYTMAFFFLWVDFRLSHQKVAFLLWKRENKKLLLEKKTVSKIPQCENVHCLLLAIYENEKFGFDYTAFDFFSGCTHIYHPIYSCATHRRLGLVFQENDMRSIRLSNTSTYLQWAFIIMHGSFRKTTDIFY